LKQKKKYRGRKMFSEEYLIDYKNANNDFNKEKIITMIKELEKIHQLDGGGVWGYPIYEKDNGECPKIVLTTMFGICGEYENTNYIIKVGMPEDEKFNKDSYVYKRTQHICKLHNILPYIIDELKSIIKD